MASTLKRFSFKAPPPRVVLLPDSLFFVRVIPVAEGASAADVAAQVELALEGMAPFPLGQMYYAHHWAAGDATAVVYAAYRKRFTAEQSDAWADAEMVMPTFATLLAAKVERSTAIVATSDTGVTILHFGGSGSGPSAILTRSWPVETTPAEQRLIRDELLRSLGGTKSVIEVTEPPVVQNDGAGSDFVIRAGTLSVGVSREQLDALDIRDKADLAARRRGRSRDLLLWRVFVACCAGIVLAGLLELGMVGGRVWHRSRQAKVEAQAPAVAEIMNAQSLATRIEELSTKRQRPLEMISIVAGNRPKSVNFSRATTTGVYSLEVEAYTNAPADVSSYQAALRQMPQIEKVDVQSLGIREGTSVFKLVVTFHPNAFQGPTT